MDWQSLDGEIDDLHEMITSAFSPLSGRRIHHPYGLFGDMVYDWRPAWDKAREIQALFSSGVRYPTAGAREAAWVRFNNVRSELSRRSNADRDNVFMVSKAWRDLIIDELDVCRYSVLGEIVVFFDPTTADEMKALGARLKEVSRKLTDNKHQMLREHKDECFQKIQEVRATHDIFWGRYKESREIKQQQFQQKIRDVLDRVEQNISKNYEKLEKAANALQRAEENIYKLEAMLSTAKGDDFREKVEGWLAEALEKHASIRESIRRMKDWIKQDETRRDDILSKMR